MSISYQDYYGSWRRQATTMTRKEASASASSVESLPFLLPPGAEDAPAEERLARTAVVYGIVLADPNRARARTAPAGANPRQKATARMKRLRKLYGPEGREREQQIGDGGRQPLASTTTAAVGAKDAARGDSVVDMAARRAADELTPVDVPGADRHLVADLSPYAKVWRFETVSSSDDDGAVRLPALGTRAGSHLWQFKAADDASVAEEQRRAAASVAAKIRAAEMQAAMEADEDDVPRTPTPAWRSRGNSSPRTSSPLRMASPGPSGLTPRAGSPSGSLNSSFASTSGGPLALNASMSQSLGSTLGTKLGQARGRAESIADSHISDADVDELIEWSKQLSFQDYVDKNLSDWLPPV